MQSLKIDQSKSQSNLSMINTQIITPISINQDSATFIIRDQGGSLDKHTCLILPATVSNNNSFYPINTGVASLLDSVSLMANGKVIAQNTEPGNYISLSNSFEKQEYRRRVLQCRMGIKESYSPSDTGILYPIAGNAGDILNCPGKIELSDLNRPYIVPNLGEWNSDHNSFSNNPNYILTDSSVTTGQFYLYLKDLFPKMYGGLEIPTYLISDQLSLVVRFSNNSPKFNQNERVLCDSSCVLYTQTDTANAGRYVPNCQILIDEVKLLTDYLIPTQQAKQAITEKVMSDEGLVLTYGDFICNTFFLEGLPPTNVTSTRNFKRSTFHLGLSNKILRQMYIFFNPTQNNLLTAGETPYAPSVSTTENADTKRSFSPYNSINCLKGKYASKALSHLPDGEKIQISMNSKNLFNTPLESSGQKIHELQTAYGKLYCMPMCTYDFSDFVVDEVDAEYSDWSDNLGKLLYQKSIMCYTAGVQGWNQQNLIGQNHVIGANFQRPVLTSSNQLIRMNISNSGQRVSTLPIEISIDRLVPQLQGVDDRNMVVCCTIEKTMTLKNGQIYIDEL